jgi:hypothetical protein
LAGEAEIISDGLTSAEKVIGQSDPCATIKLKNEGSID